MKKILFAIELAFYIAFFNNIDGHSKEAFRTNSVLDSLIGRDFYTNKKMSLEVFGLNQNPIPRLRSPYILPPATMYVSPSGSDNNDGRSVDTPFKTITKAAATVQPGDVIYLRGGVFPIKATFHISGTSSQKIVWASYPGEWAIFDGSELPKAPQSKHFLTVKANHNVFANFTISNGPHRGLIVFGSNNLITGLVSHGHNFTGIQNYNGNNNVFEWCVAYDNYDTVPMSGDPTKAGNNADGIGITTGKGNIIRWNLVYNNSDDGIDVWEGENSLVEHNMAYDNGYGPEGNGNGFKGGGPSGGNNVFTNNVAFHNKKRGFTDNNATNVFFINNTAYNNNKGDNTGTAKYGASFQATQPSGNIFKNNLTIPGTGNTLDISPNSTQENNSWNLNIIEPQFKSTIRNNHNFLHLSPDSPAIGVGEGGVNLGSDASTLDLLRLYAAGTSSTPINLGPQEISQTALGSGQRNLFVSPTGSGSDCSQESPCNLKIGISKSQAGDVVFLRGGQYDLPLENIQFNKSGKQGNPIIYESYPGELAIFDGADHAKAAKVRISLSGSWVALRRVEVRNMPQTGLRITGNHNLMDGIHSHHNSGTGIHIFSDYKAYPYGAEGSFNTVKNSLVHDNSDAGLTYADDNWGNNGGDADGISISSGDGNRAINNLIYHNSDDGVDSWRSTNTEFAYNIIHSNGIANGNGNGIKAGGVNQSFNTYVHHNISFNNRATGIDFNSGIDVLFYNNVSYNNHMGYTLGKTTTTVNNIEFGNMAPSYRSGNHHHNSWNLSDYTVSETDFISLDPNSVGFLKLNAKSGLLNIGFDVGFPFNGTAPDLGVYEQY
ncbi:right-handed parallel beta-helix repeat-containing protein [uncultured Cyclobacterium sp.]|uniref:right-handed parallel beta-helix repeat-containing protein n=1 Tax=uncultured Cyclobacterium sp. TaxID=453820 RepID=UPI0030EDEE49|tara:strand:+ start:290033 stop:292519 length:2487 start_codon:yes stop_codon:yes gene_type:complete